MPTVLEVLRKTADFLARKGVPQPKPDTEWLLAGALHCRRLDLYLRFDQELDEAVLAPLREQVARRGKREPLQYITGRAGFLDFEAKCDRRALVPRPETEELASAVFEKLPAPPKRALDLGTGTGVLAIALARHWPDCEVTALEASADTLALARENAATLKVEGQIHFIEGRWPEMIKPELGHFDLIVSNPPYLSEAELAAAEPEVREWEPRGALIAAENGLADLRAILARAPLCLSPGGLLALETGPEQHAALREMARETKSPDGEAAYGQTETVRDLSKRDRIFLAWRAGVTAPPPPESPR